MVYVNFDMDFDEFMDMADDFEVESYVKAYIRDSDPEWIAGVVAESTLGSLSEVDVLLEDPAKRLEIITALRAQGYIVEPAPIVSVEDSL
jgi:hypothetical protein